MRRRICTWQRSNVTFEILVASSWNSGFAIIHIYSWVIFTCSISTKKKPWTFPARQIQFKMIGNAIHHKNIATVLLMCLPIDRFEKSTVKSNRRTIFHEVQPQTSCNQHEPFFHIIWSWTTVRYNNSRHLCTLYFLQLFWYLPDSQTPATSLVWLEVTNLDEKMYLFGKKDTKAKLLNWAKRYTALIFVDTYFILLCLHLMPQFFSGKV